MDIFLELVYKDAIERELYVKQIPFDREREYKIQYKGAILRHKFCADFVVNNSIILEVKAAEAGLANLHIAQTLNYLKVSECKVGLLVNFGRESLEYRRLVF